MNPERLSRIVALSSIFVSGALAATKIVVGLHANSTALVSDGMESAGDVLASGLVLFGLVIAAMPPDDRHPYGHGRMETLAGLAVGIILIASGSLIGFRSLQRAWEPQHAPAAYAVWPLLASIAIKGTLSVTKRHFGRKIRSSALAADAWNDSVDVLSGSVALIGLSLTLWNPEKLPAADHFGGTAVAIIVIFLGVHVVRETALHLMDTMPEPEAMESIRRVAMSVPGALGIEKCFARKTGLKWHVDLHLEVDPAMSVFESHELATQVKTSIREQLDWVADVLVHVEPHMLATLSGKSDGKS